MNRYCKRCGLLVAPYDKMQVKTLDMVFHSKCYAETVKATTNCHVKKLEQTEFKFPTEGLYIH